MQRIQDLARGRWKDILLGVGLPASALSGSHGPCPMCGGKDRFRYDDRGGNGTFICSHCGAGNGVDLVMKWLKVDFRTAKSEIEKYLPVASFQVRKASSGSVKRIEDYIASIWSRGMRLTGNDPASRYLQSRGIYLDRYPSQLRYVSDALYRHEDGSRSRHPAMLAKFVSPDAQDWTVHFTYLTETGRKADVPKQRKLAPMQMPPGGCVRLCMSAEQMGIAEGIETSLSAGIIHKLPVWAALSTTALMKWKPPSTVRSVIVFADNDDSYGGQHAAYALAYELRGAGLDVEVRMPAQRGYDWNDVLMSQRSTAA